MGRKNRQQQQPKRLQPKYSRSDVSKEILPRTRGDTSGRMQNKPASGTVNTNAVTRDESAPKTRKSGLGTIWGIWGKAWAIFGPILTIIGSWQLYTPHVAITSGVNLDSSQQFQTQFVVTNTGKVAVYDLRFTCELLGDAIAIGSLASRPPDLLPVAQLPPGAPVSRGCFSESRNISGETLRVTTHYKWPLFNKDASVEAYFSVRSGQGGFFLVPEAPPDPSLPSLIRLNLLEAPMPNSSA